MDERLGQLVQEAGRCVLGMFFLCLSLVILPLPLQAAPPESTDLETQLLKHRRDPTWRARRGAVDSLLYLNRLAARDTRAQHWRGVATRFLQRLEAGENPYTQAKGDILPRAYRSPLSQSLQGYAVYLPPNYDPAKAWPLYVALHGGSSNGNLFLGVVLGNNMPWQAYKEHLWDHYRPRWSPDWIVVAPDGFGQVMWRWMGERDVLDVIADVQRHYHVDPERVVLGGLSNGGVGSYAIGTRHAWRFSVVQAMAGAPSWLQYTGGKPTRAEKRAILPWSALHLAPNIRNTRFEFYHGRTDPGPMRPPFVEAFSKRLKALGLPHHQTWYNAGHDILYLVHRHGKRYAALAEHQRPTQPTKVYLVTSDYRAARQFWLEVTRIQHYPQQVALEAELQGKVLRVAAPDAVQGLRLYVQDAPLPAEVVLKVNDQELYTGSSAALGDRLELYRDAEQWHLGFAPKEGLVKRPGLSGPLTDAYVEPMVHVYGTQVPEDTAALKQAAQKGARGWPLWLWHFRQPVLADHEVDEALMQRAHLVLYGNRRNHRLLAKVHADPKRAPPIRCAWSKVAEANAHALSIGARSFAGASVGVRYIYPNPLAADRYIIVQSACNQAAAVGRGNNLPDFVPDYVVYDAKTTAKRARLISGKQRALLMGYFNDRWQLP